MPDLTYLSATCTATDTKTGHAGCYDKGCSCWCHDSFYAGLYPAKKD